ncbi:TRAP transporter fused permease subunit [Alphaproteobacteria bacterium]|jgi:TRAP transporter 4TM/12TM fusion protein|nr:TRAP transporter fused permease subunit [Alphaproteobacteria bacterium]MDC1169635.1 TRAP transporter fused permease subunit [bacterium]MDB2532212.1 TRAP transporter fused permease subunit [Alphaproteobacteria bacterium]MDB3897059.1 TRAP transporter fused permease subunit [Alphaproteobacteria bacterium]MDC1036978.1 TRAP transporter fused permease subunit [Alphaproteobacteria bacterium]
MTPFLKSTRSIWIGLGALSVVFHLWLIFSGLVPNLVSRPLHMALVIPWVFLFKPSVGLWRIFDWGFTLAGIAACFWIIANHNLLLDQYGYLANDFQMVIAVILLVTVLEMARRSIGWPLPLLAFAALLYGLFGNYIPGEFGHPGTPLASFLGTMTIAEGGIWGTLTGVSVSIVAIFVIFGAMLNAGEAGAGFMNVAASAAGRLRGGAAKVSVLSSALFGSISGSASANVASTGIVTLPTMVSLGYPKRIAAAVEAVASSGGQIMPPLMGAGAFVMVELTGIPYGDIIVAAALPALLYFFAVWIGVDIYALRFGLRPLNNDARPAVRTVLITASFFLIPFSVLLIVMYIGFTPQYAAAVAILAATLLLFINGSMAINLGSGMTRICDAAIMAGGQIAMIASIILCASIIIGVLGITGLGIKVTSLILSFSGGMIWPALLLTALACLFLGMEVPTTAAYVICVSVAGPALIDLGMAPLTVHLFVFWYALLSTITPPVCGGVFIAAGMVGENWLRVALTSMSLGIGLYLIPLGMVVHPELLTIGVTPLLSLLAFCKIAFALGLISYAVISAGKSLHRLISIILGMALLLAS